MYMYIEKPMEVESYMYVCVVLSKYYMVIVINHITVDVPLAPDTEQIDWFW